MESLRITLLPLRTALKTPKPKCIVKMCLLIISIVFFSCSENLENPVENDPLAIFQISSETNSFISPGMQELANARLEVDFDFENVLFVAEEELELGRFVVLSQSDPSKSLTFNVLETGDLVDMRINVVTVVGENTVLSEMYSIDGELVASMTDNLNENHRHVEVYAANGRVEKSWWNYFSECVEQINEPFHNWFINNYYQAVVNGSTMGLYTPLSAVVCAGVATGQKNRDGLTYYSYSEVINRGVEITVNDLICC